MNKRLQQIIDNYEDVVKNIHIQASSSTDRSYGGLIRAKKGKLQETIAEDIVSIAWEDLDGDKERLLINSSKEKIPIQREYIQKISDKGIREYLLRNEFQNSYSLSVDKHVFIDNKLVIGIECKAYTENAMLKRILVDFSLLKTIHSEMSCYLLQLESQLGGDYSKLRKITYGSPSTHTLMSYFPSIALNIITLLPGERDINNPIHKPGGFKALTMQQLKKAVATVQKDLKRHLAPPHVRR